MKIIQIKFVFFLKKTSGQITTFIVFDKQYFPDRCQDIRLEMIFNRNAPAGEWVDFKVFCNENEIPKPEKPESDWFDKNISREEIKKWYDYFAEERKWTSFKKPFQWVRLSLESKPVEVEKEVIEENRTLFSPLFRKTTKDHKLIDDYTLFFLIFGGKGVYYYGDNIVVYDDFGQAEVIKINNKDLKTKIDNSLLKKGKTIDLTENLIFFKDPLLTPKETQKLLDALKRVGEEDIQIEKDRPKGFFKDFIETLKYLFINNANSKNNNLASLIGSFFNKNSPIFDPCAEPLKTKEFNLMPTEDKPLKIGDALFYLTGDETFIGKNSAGEIVEISVPLNEQENAFVFVKTEIRNGEASLFVDVGNKSDAIPFGSISFADLNRQNLRYKESNDNRVEKKITKKRFK